jgi:SOS-response transcriptional repressor LexA
MTKHDAYRPQRILEYIAMTTPSPSIREIAAKVGLASTSAVAHHVDALIRDGLLTEERGQARTLRPTAEGFDAIGIDPCPALSWNGACGMTFCGRNLVKQGDRYRHDPRTT